MKYIKMKNGLTAIIDDDDFHKISNIKWNTKKEYNNLNWAYGRIYKEDGIKFVYLHRYIMNAQKNDVVEPVNGNTLDCRKENLKIITRSMCGRRSRKWKSRNGKKCTSVFKGVYYDKNAKTWKACISINGKPTYLGAFFSEIDAASKYNEVCKEIAENYAYENKPTIRNSKICNMTEIEKDIKNGIIPFNIGEMLLREILYKIVESFGVDTYNNNVQSILYNSIIFKLTEKKFIFNQEELDCIFKEFPVFSNQDLINNKQLEEEVIDFLNQKRHYEIRKSESL